MKSIRVKIALMLLGVITLYVLMTVFMNAFMLKKYYMKSKENTLKSSYSLITEQLDKFEDSEELKTEIESIEDSNNTQVYIINEEFEPVYSSRGYGGVISKPHSVSPSDGAWFSQWLVPREKNRPGKPYEFIDDPNTTRRIGNKLGAEYISLSATYTNKDTEKYYIVLNTPISAIEESVGIYNRFAFYALLAILVVGAFFTTFISERTVAPFREMSKTAQKIANLDFTDRVPVTSDDEIGQLAQSINEMSDQLEAKIQELSVANEQLKKDIKERETIDRMRTELISNVSHELKTPLSIIMGYSEGLQLGVNSEERDYYCSIIQDEAEKMNDLASRLLNIAELESGGAPLEMTTFDLSRLAQDRAAKLKILLSDNNISISCAESGNCSITADMSKMEEVINNLLSNAMHHTTENGCIEVKVTEKIDDVEFSVYNSGSHIPEASIKLIWDSFFKVDKARTRKYGGSGLGLKIVSTILESHSNAGIKTSYGAENVKDGVIFRFTVSKAKEKEKNNE